MAGLKILRVFLVLLVSLMEIRCEQLVNEDYYSFEDPSPDNGNIVTQSTWTDAATSESAINVMEVDAGSGEGPINQRGDKTGDLSTERYLFEEDLPSADEIFKVFENDSLEITTTITDLETTKNEHIKQIFEKLGVTKDVVTVLFRTAPTEATLTQQKDSAEEEEDKTMFSMTEAAETKSSEQILEKLGITVTDLFRTAPTEATVILQKDISEEAEEKTMFSMTEAAETNKSHEVLQELEIGKDIDTYRHTDLLRRAPTEATPTQQKDVPKEEDKSIFSMTEAAETKNSHLVEQEPKVVKDLVNDLLGKAPIEVQQKDVIKEDKTILTITEAAETKNPHQVLQEIGVEKSPQILDKLEVTDLFRTAHTEATQTQEKDIPEEEDKTKTEVAETKNSQQILEKLGVTDLFRAASTEATLIQQKDGVEEEDKTMPTITEETETEDYQKNILLLNASVNGNLQITNWEEDNFLENEADSVSKEIEENKLDEATFDSPLKNKVFEEKLLSSEDEKLSSLDFSETEQTNENQGKGDEVFTASTEITQTTTSTSILFDETASSAEISYENYYTNSLEENHSFVTSVTVDPALYEYEARSSEDETKTTTQSHLEETFVSVNGHRKNKGLDVEKINDNLDFESSTIDDGDIFKETTVRFEPETTESSNSVPTESTTKQTETSFTEEFASDTTRILADSSETSTKDSTDDFTEEFGSDTTRILADSSETSTKDSTDDFTVEFESDSTRILADSSETSTKHSIDDFATMKWNRLPLIDEDVISLTTHTPTARILTESVSLVTENRAENSNLADPQINPCLKLNFTGQIKTNESMIAIPNNANVFGICTLNEVFVNITWRNEHNVKVNLFFNFTEDLLTNIQMNLQHDNLLFEQSKKVEIGSTNHEVQIEFEDEHILELSFFEFSTRYDNSSLMEDFEPIPASEELQSNNSLLLEIVVGCVGLVVVLAVAGFYIYKKYWGQRDNFKPAAAA